MAPKTIGAVVALALLIGAQAATGASWDERVFSSHVDFDAVAAAGAAAIPDADRARQDAVQGQVHHRGRGRAAEGDPGDRADQAQVRRQPRLHPHQRPGFEFLLRLPQRPGRGRQRRLRLQRLRLGGFRERAVRLDRSLVLERAAHGRVDGRRAGRIAGARDDGRPPSRARRRGQAGARQRPGRARRSRQQGRAVRRRSPPIPTASSISIRSMGSTPI